MDPLIGKAESGPATLNALNNEGVEVGESLHISSAGRDTSVAKIIEFERMLATLVGKPTELLRSFVTGPHSRARSSLSAPILPHRRLPISGTSGNQVKGSTGLHGSEHASRTDKRVPSTRARSMITTNAIAGGL